MNIDLILQRRRAAEEARAYLSGERSWEEFIDRYTDNDDDLIAELVDLLEHEPKRGGFLGASEKQWAQYQSRLSSAIAALES